MKVRDNERRTVVQKKQSVADCRMQAIQTKRNDMTRRCLENQTRSLTVVWLDPRKVRIPRMKSPNVSGSPSSNSNLPRVLFCDT